MAELPTSEPRLRSWIDATAHLYLLPEWNFPGERFSPGEWFEALFLQEDAQKIGEWRTSGRITGRRYEGHQDRIGAETADTPGVDDLLLEDDASYGPLQVMGTNVKVMLGLDRNARVPLNFGFLYDWLLGTGCGMWVLLQELSATSRDVSRALARYNGGPSGEAIGPDGKMRRQDYVDGVLNRARLVKADRRRLDWYERFNDS